MGLLKQATILHSFRTAAKLVAERPKGVGLKKVRRCFGVQRLPAAVGRNSPLPPKDTVVLVDQPQLLPPLVRRRHRLVCATPG
jgi:hypothetical protein